MSTNITTITVCRYVLATKSLSIRAAARAIGIHHRTWQRYLNGKTRPGREIKYKMIRFMQVDSFEILVNDAFLYFSPQRELDSG